MVNRQSLLVTNLLSWLIFSVTQVLWCLSEIFQRFYTVIIDSVLTFGQTCWEGWSASIQDTNRLDENIEKAGGVVGRRQESIGTGHHRLSTNDKASTVLVCVTKHTNWDLNLITDTPTGSTGLAFLVIRQNDSLSHSFQRLIWTHNQQSKQLNNTQWQQLDG